MKLKKRYVIEYIDNPLDLEKFDSHPNPWELFKKETIEEESAHDVYTGADSIDGKAWQKFILWNLCPDQIFLSNGNKISHPLFCQMWMEMLDEDGNVVYEDFCELPSTIKNTLYSAINNQANKERNAAKEAVLTLEKELEVYKQFIKQCRAENTFDEWRKDHAEIC